MLPMDTLPPLDFQLSPTPEPLTAVYHALISLLTTSDLLCRLCWGSPRPPPRFSDSLGGLNVIQQLGMCMAMFYFVERV